MAGEIDGGVAERLLVNVVEERVALGPLRRDLLPIYGRRINDFETIRVFGPAPRPMTAEQIEAWYDRQIREEEQARFTIYETGTWQPLGFTALLGIDQRNRTAEFVILIGERDRRAKGYGTEATRLMLDYAFTALGLHSVLLRVAAYNVAGRRAYERAGFRAFGQRRASHAMGGKL